ncbi:OmpP1/FadL family transporter [Hydrogenimonas urashimensis]|uniref:OmpP1/FadL family transporter n=1 Tax=Hydrogenimonas urashimensis TaxID=2740515 RepID=UPI0019152058|nr:outer membrane protein transport protein [Hydrogenimonas urashimensis]
MRHSRRPIVQTTLLAFFVTPLLATNGDLLIGVGAKTRGMGGAGIAYGHKSESTLVNPALIATTPSREMSVGATFFYPDIETKTSIMDDYDPSDSDFYVIPFASVSKPMGDHWYVGLGMWGTAGLGTDFEGNPALFNMQTQLMLMQIALPVAYRMGNWSFGAAPIVEYGSLDISYHLGGIKIDPDAANDFGFGWSAGFTYDFGNGLIVGAVYKSPVEMKYKGVLSDATLGALDDRLTQPEEMGVGIDYNWATHHSVAIDYKRIGWGSVEGYEDFNWKDQDVFAIGYEYATTEWALRLGYNHAKSPIELSPGGFSNGGLLNMLNLLGFPATAEDHYTTGVSYTISDISSMDLAFVYAPQTMVEAPIVLKQNIAVRHSEFSFTVQYNYKY